MLDILTIVHGFADIQTASRIRCTCRRLAVLIPQPTITYSKTYKYIYKVGSKLHRLDGPAWECILGYKYWYRGGIEHREYHPQITDAIYRKYVIDGVYHREVGPSFIEEAVTKWYMRGLLHRKIGPAYKRMIDCWYTLGKLHRLDGTAYSSAYIIRGVEHRISSAARRDLWIVNDVFIRE